MPTVEFAFATEKGHHILHGKVLDTLATLNSSVGKFSLCFLQVDDTLFNGILYAETVDSYVNGLVKTMNTVDCLFFYELWSPLVSRSM